MYAKASCDESHKHKKIPILPISFFFSCSTEVFPSLWTHLVLTEEKQLMCLKDNYLYVFEYQLERCIITEAISKLEKALAHCGAKLK